MDVDLDALLGHTERTTVEFKQAVDSSRVKRAIVCFANDWQNEGGGTVLVGVDDDGAVVGLPDDPDKLMLQLANYASDGSIDPKPQIEVETVSKEGKLIGVIEVRRGDRAPYRLAGSAYIRIGTMSRKTTFEEEKSLENRAFSPVQEPLQGWLPSRDEIATRFVGRKGYLETLGEWLVDADARRCTLVGQGGSGKSAIAYQLATSVRTEAPKPLELVLWITAKQRQYKEGIVYPNAPDFWDLDSALTKLLTDSGYQDLISESPEDNQTWLLEVLNAHPTLLVIDDLDTLMHQSKEMAVAKAVEFLTLTVPSITPTKLLVTSRIDQRLGLMVPIRGFTQRSVEGRRFLDSRLAILGMDSSILSVAQGQAVLRETAGIPLFAEDMLRLFKVNGDLDRTLEDWKSKKGDSAREFALRVEFDSLGDVAKHVLLTCCEFPPPVSIEDIRGVTGYGMTDIEYAMLELQGLFLVSSPELAGGAVSFRANENTKRLAQAVLGDTPQMTSVREAIDSVTGEINQNHIVKRQVSAYVKRAFWRVKELRFIEAESILKEGLTQPGLSEHPELYSWLGWVYKKWKPRAQTTRARESFKRASELKVDKPEPYFHWAELEVEEENWSEAVAAAESGRSLLGAREPLGRLGFILGYAKSRLGQRLAREGFRDKAIEQLAGAEDILERTLVSPEDVPVGEWALHGKIHLALYINAESFYRLTSQSVWSRKMIMQLDRWNSEHPYDPRCAMERTRARQLHPEIFV